MATEAEHPDLSPELRLLAQRLLGLLEPLLEAGVAFASGVQRADPGKCQQVWCPVCAVAALASGKQHPLMTILSTHGAALLPLLRDLVNPTASTAAPSREGMVRTPDGPGRYQHIDVTVHDT